MTLCRRSLNILHRCVATVYLGAVKCCAFNFCVALTTITTEAEIHKAKMNAVKIDVTKTKTDGQKQENVSARKSQCTKGTAMTGRHQINRQP